MVGDKSPTTNLMPDWVCNPVRDVKDLCCNPKINIADGVALKTPSGTTQK
jgi:hypothetical protein